MNEVTQVRSDRDYHRRRMAAHWNDHDVYVILMPVFVGPTSAHDTATYKSYTSIWNVVDYPSIAIPTPLFTKNKGLERYIDQNSIEQEDQYVRHAYEYTSFEGAPLGLQLVS